MTDGEELHAVVLGVVRGQRELTDLDKIGIGMTRRGGALVFGDPKGLVVRVSPVDIARGLVAHAWDRTALQTWAEFVLAASSYLELNLEEEPYGSSLLAALWDASDGQPISAAALLIAKELCAH